MDAARHVVRVHAVAIDEQRRLLLDRDPSSRAWTLPMAVLTGDEDPTLAARGLVRSSGAFPGMPRITEAVSSVERGEAFLDLTYQCDAKRVWKTAPRSSRTLWWSLDEISTLDLSPRVRSALVHVWSQLWADPVVVNR